MIIELKKSKINHKTINKNRNFIKILKLISLNENIYTSPYPSFKTNINFLVHIILIIRFYFFSFVLDSLKNKLPKINKDIEKIKIFIIKSIKSL